MKLEICHFQKYPQIQTAEMKCCFSLTEVTEITLYLSALLSANLICVIRSPRPVVMSSWRCTLHARWKSLVLQAFPICKQREGRWHWRWIMTCTFFPDWIPTWSKPRKGVSEGAQFVRCLAMAANLSSFSVRHDGRVWNSITSGNLEWWR